MGITITPNVVVCPHCEKQFEYNRVNGLALIELAQTIESQKRMHCRLTLDSLELQYPNKKLPPAVKKAVLDGYNELARGLHAVLGFGQDVE